MNVFILFHYAMAESFGAGVFAKSLYHFRGPDNSTSQERRKISEP